MFQLFGLDMIIDDNLQAHLIEINQGPDTNCSGVPDCSFKNQIYQDIYDLVINGNGNGNGSVTKNNFVKVL